MNQLEIGNAYRNQQNPKQQKSKPIIAVTKPVPKPGSYWMCGHILQAGDNCLCEEIRNEN